MGLSANIKYRLNRLFGQTPTDVQLGDLIDSAYTPDDGTVTTDKLAALAVTAAKIAADAVTTAKILNANVTKAKLATGISANLMVMYAGDFTTVGGDVNESIPVVGMLGTDTVHVVVRTPGAVPVSIATVTPGADAIAVVMSADPAADHVLSYIVMRATS